MPDPLSDLSAALDAAASALTPLLPSENGLSLGGPASAVADLRPTLPGGDARIVASGIGGLDGSTLVVALAADLADILEQGPRGMLDLAEVLRPALSAALESMAGRLGPLSLGATSVVGPDEGPPGGDAVAAQLVDGDRVAVTVALVVPAAGPLAAGADPAPAAQPAAPAPAAVAALASFDPLGAGLPGGPAGNGVHRSLEVLHDVEMGVTAELGRTRLTVRTLLGLVPGAVVELDRAAGSQVDLLVNGTLIARGEVVVIDDEFGVRISEVVGGLGAEGRR